MKMIITIIQYSMPCQGRASVFRPTSVTWLPEVTCGALPDGEEMTHSSWRTGKASRPRQTG